ncbi:hypothetical protein Mgra_00003920 [Meloidogyne graminicola]|uniref:Uncharacterized protein n=1 Tax=Meloidogyne graminicola TaxID=189291 RepID=A0A8S9ZU70_9BILA|nr:hypothetical protein Mgra_00003920 [Meloidogyne graminicola]
MDNQQQNLQNPQHLMYHLLSSSPYNHPPEPSFNQQQNLWAEQLSNTTTTTKNGNVLLQIGEQQQNPSSIYCPQPVKYENPQSVMPMFSQIDK